MKPITENAIFKFSVGILITMAIGLVMGTKEVVSLGFTQDRQGSDIVEIQSKQAKMDAMAVDMAVLKAQVISINEKLDILIKQ